MTTEKPTDGEILSNVLDALNLSANKLSVKMGYKSPSSIYNILDDEHYSKISLDFANKLVELFGNVNFLYLTQGKEPILIERGMAIGQKNFLNNDQPSYNDVPGYLEEIRDLLKIVVNHITKDEV